METPVILPNTFLTTMDEKRCRKCGVQSTGVTIVQKIGYPDTFFLFRPNGQEVEFKIKAGQIIPASWQLWNKEREWVKLNLIPQKFVEVESNL